jgi:Zn-dependent protease with chaperone function
MSEYHCRIYGKDGAEAQSTQVHVEPDRFRLTDSAYSNYRLPFDKVFMKLIGSGPYCVQLKVPDEDLTIVLTDLDVLTEIAATANGTKMGDRATELKQRLVRQHRNSSKKWLIVAAVLIGLPIVFLLLLDSTVNLALAQFSSEYEARLGSWIASSEKVRTENAEQKRVQEIGDRLISKLHKAPYKFHFFVEKNEQINACAYPGGVVVVNSALVEAANDDELAGVIGHEIGHVLHRDTLKATMHDLGLSLSFTAFTHLIGMGGDTGDLKGQRMADLMEKLESLSFSRGQEAFADKEGVRLAMMAGYSGDGLVQFFEKERAKKGRDGGLSEKLTGLFSTHPLDNQRIAAIKEEIEKIKAEDRTR